MERQRLTRLKHMKSVQVINGVGGKKTACTVIMKVFLMRSVLINGISIVTVNGREI